MCRKILLLVLIVLTLTAAKTEAAKTDMYRNALLNKTFTIKYEVITLPVRDTKKDAPMTNFGLITGNDISIRHGGFIVSNGNDRYLEIYQTADIAKKLTEKNTTLNSILSGLYKDDIDEGGICLLSKNNEIFSFRWDMKDGQKRYYRNKTIWGTSKSVRANEGIQKTPYQELVESYTFGLPEIANALLAIIPQERVIDSPDIPRYKFLSSGTLPNGLSYEDYISEKPHMINAVRYYFQGNDMVKIAMANYMRDAQGIQGYEKSVINITEFSTVPDEKYLSLPAGLKDKTKRKEGNSK